MPNLKQHTGNPSSAILKADDYTAFGVQQKSRTAAHEAVRRIDALYTIEREKWLSAADRKTRARAQGAPFARELARLGHADALANVVFRQARQSLRLFAHPLAEDSLISTAKANHIEPQAYLHGLFAAIPQAKCVEDFERLLQNNGDFSQDRSKNYRKWTITEESRKQTRK